MHHQTRTDTELHGLCPQSVDFWAVNTDAQALAANQAPNKLQIGVELTRGLGCGGMPELGRQAALESQDALKTMVTGAGKAISTRYSTGTVMLRGHAASAVRMRCSKGQARVVHMSAALRACTVNANALIWPAAC